MKARRLIVIAAGLAFGAAITVACFPEVQFAPDDDAAPDGNTHADTSVSDVTTIDSPSKPVDAAADVFEGLDANLLDVFVPEDAGGKVDAAGCTSCDCDKDGYNRELVGTDCGAAPFDCDDNDSRSHPGQVFLKEDAEAPMNGNWNCVDGVEKPYPENVTCDGLTLGNGCTNIYGFTKPVACGQTGTFVRCKQALILGLLSLSCELDPEAVDNTKVQPCK